MTRLLHLPCGLALTLSVTLAAACSSNQPPPREPLYAQSTFPQPPPRANNTVAPPPPASGAGNTSGTLYVQPPPRTVPPPPADPNVVAAGPQRQPGLLRRLADATGLSEALPNAGSGLLSVIRIANVRLELNPRLRDPLTALGACADLVTYCYSPPSQSLDQCMTSAPSCQTAQPWRENQCCPTACRTAYQTARRNGQTEMQAFESVFFQQPDCFPGVRQMLATGRAP
jgi:hypothetical protein